MNRRAQALRDCIDAAINYDELRALHELQRELWDAQLGVLQRVGDEPQMLARYKALDVARNGVRARIRDLEEVDHGR